MVIFYKKWKKYNEFQLTKNKMDLNIRKMTNHPPSPAVVKWMRPKFRGEPLEQVNCFKYLRSQAATDEGYERDVIHRINLTISTFSL